MSLTDVHTRLYFACLVYAIILGVWAFSISVQNRLIDSNFLGALVICEILFVVVAIIDVILIASSGILPGRPVVHLLYTATGVLSIPSAYAFTRGQATAREASIYGAVCLFLAGIAIRAIVTTVV